MKLRDYHVQFKSREDIARFALEWWLLATRTGHTFNICTFIRDVLTKRLRGKGTLQIKFYDDAAGLPEQACVTYEPLTLHIVRRIWDDANIGKAYARFILAHEIGHIVLHDHRAVAFSDDKAAQLTFVQKEGSAEWQANTFADLFLVPDHVAGRLHDADVISGLCVVTDKVAIRRVNDLERVRSPLQPHYEGEMCGRCGNFTLMRNGPCMKCDTCGSVKGHL